MKKKYAHLDHPSLPYSIKIFRLEKKKIHTRMFAHNVGPTSEKSIKTNDIKHER